MAKYNTVSEEFLEELRAAIGAEHVRTDAATLDTYKTDEEKDERCFHLPDVVIAPADAQEIAAVVKLCNKYLVPLTVRGGGTGITDGAIAVCGGAVLLMERLNKIIELNKEGMYLVAQAGVRTIDIQKAANEQGFLYAGDPCSAESCQIGGNLATNAGGNKAVRYGVTRNQVYAVQIVTPTGEIVDLGAPLKKCSTGYCMEQLVIGSEGTLGIITQVTLKLQPLPPYRLDLLAVFTDPVQAMSVVPKIIKAGINPTSIEYMDNANVRTTSRFLEFSGAPHADEGIYVIVTVETFNEDELDMKMEQLDAICEECGAIDVLEADDRIWAMRRNCLESVSLISKVCTTDDVVVPVDEMSDMVKFIIATVRKYPFPLRINAHIGDGNLHIVLCKMDLSDEEWESNLRRFTQEVYTYAYAHGGRLAGEHGIGAKKREFLEEFTPAGELELMRKIKRAWDPNLILNPGKVFNA
ncbi:MAG: FAD-binding oxidoreductase [Phascolarctobacterium sp.]|uniref:FAD-binding oxidoreductase n=1 Tax=Phascolarctobacterium sp. TaxID=2049039 RepID=UPI0026DBD142|nr:FAD-binding oxidoreductase [Phascolarctobacterium sp.]MDO4920384.1 FAD-binding oxidoreductase [Phascolarctobacterium sp.]